MSTPSLVGPLALVGSGEYTSAMDETDRALLAAQGGPPLVAVIPTASGLEPGMPERWNAQGVAHFAALGAQANAVPLVIPTDAHDERVLALLRDRRFYYFSGGSPDYAIETLRDTPAWQIIRAAYADGAALAGCSAGAMLLGGACLSVRGIRNGEAPRFTAALGVVPQLVIMPHFDRLRGFMGSAAFAAALAAVPNGLIAVGIDEDTALVWTPAAGWSVSGRQQVTVFWPHGTQSYKPGEPVPHLSAPVA